MGGAGVSISSDFLPMGSSTRSRMLELNVEYRDRYQTLSFTPIACNLIKLLSDQDGETESSWPRIHSDSEDIATGRGISHISSWFWSFILDWPLIRLVCHLVNRSWGGGKGQLHFQSQVKTLFLKHINLTCLWTIDRRLLSEMNLPKENFLYLLTPELPTVAPGNEE